MRGGLLFALLARALAALRRLGRPRALARLSARDAQGYALAIAYMLQARLWTLRRRQPTWPALQRAWAAAENDAAARDARAGRLHAQDCIELIADGAAGFARREGLYAQARECIDIATYYVQSDATGRATVRALAGCVARGVKVRLLVDRTMTSKKTLEVPGMQALLDEVLAAGIEFKAWHDPQRPYDSNHRKMIVVDRQSALVGGRNFADHYRGDAWRDVDLVLQGPSAEPLAQVFDAVWAAAESGGDAAHTLQPWVDRVPAGIRSDPMLQFAIAAVGAARHTVCLELAYFVAHDTLCGALANAARRGVRVHLLTNSAQTHDLPYAVWTAYEGARRLLGAGCSVHARRGAGRTLHCKYLVVDDEWVSFGSHNLDYYSARYCCENNLIVRDVRLGALLSDFFAAGVAEATPLTMAEVQAWLAGAGPLKAFDRVFRDFQ